MQTEGQNLFELWKEGGEKLPFKAVLNSWNEDSGHYALIETIQIKTWPYGTAIGQYFFNGVAGKRGVIANAGTYRWKLKSE